MEDQINQLLDWRPDQSLAALSTIGSMEHRSGMRHFAHGVSVITSASREERLGLTATAVCSVTADPPRLVVFVNKSARASRLILETGSLCINLLSGEQEETARVFAGMDKSRTGEERFEGANWYTLVTGAPVLEDALVNFDCRVIKVFDESSHHAFLCEVLAVKEGSSDSALLYAHGQFRKLSASVNDQV